MNKKLAQILLNAMRIREESYNKVAADAASAQAEADKARDPGNIYVGMIDYSGFYRKSVQEACSEAATAANEPSLSEPVYLLLLYAWNDCCVWAEEQLRPRSS